MENRNIPKHAVSSASGITWLDDSGIVIAVGANHAIHTLEHAIENHKIIAELAGGIRRPFLIDMTDVKAMSHAARDYYAGPEPPKAITAVAILTTSSIGKMVANLFLSLTKPVLPTKMFTDFEEAKNWLMQFVQADKSAVMQGEPV